MTSVRVAVIDSGVNPRHPHIVRVAGGASVSADGEVEEGAFLDVLGHGTAVMAAIQEKAPDAEYFAVKVFHRELRTSSTALVRAIDWCIEHGMDAVNLSLGSLNSAHAERFAQAVARASEAGTLLVAARDVDGQLCYPGCLPGVFAVGLDWDCPRDRYRWEEGVFFASGYPRPAPGVPPSRNLMGISFAVANISGFVARACDGSARMADRLRLVSDSLQRA